MNKITEELKKRKLDLQKLLPKVNINPAILTNDPVDFVNKIKAFNELSNVIDIDILDNTVIKSETINLNDVLMLARENLKKGNKLSLHFMSNCIDFPLLKDNTDLIEEIIVPAKSALSDDDFMDDFTEFVLSFDKSFQLGIYINPDELIEMFDEIFPYFDFVMLMCVTPGVQGNEFNEKVLRKIKALEKYDMKIKLDGGISYDSINRLNIKDLELINKVNSVSVGSYFCSILENAR